MTDPAPDQAAGAVELAARPFPLSLRRSSTALVVIDMQRDFLEPGGFGELLGNDVSLLRATIEPTRRVLAAARAAGLLVIHTREGHRPDLTDCPPAKLERGGKRFIGTDGPMGRILVRGERGHDIIDELAPMAGEPVIDKPGKGAFFATDLELILRDRGVRTLLVCGITTDVCVHTTMREANDRGFECLMLSDGTAATDMGNHLAALKMITMQHGVFGAHADSAALLAALG